MGNNIPCLEQVKNQTLSSSTSPYRPYKGVPPGAKSIIVQSTKRALKVEKNDLLRAPIGDVPLNGVTTALTIIWVALL